MKDVLLALLYVAFLVLVWFGIAILLRKLLRELGSAGDRLRPAPTRAIPLSDGGIEDRPIEEVRESVPLRGGPLKEGHRRLQIRDKRLAPKHRPERRIFTGKRVRQLQTRDAARLFAGTLRTRNRKIRDLATDREQLGRYGLPVWDSEADLAKALDIEVGTLRHFSMHRDADSFQHYVSFAIPKRTGGMRVIMAPKRRLKKLQRAVLELLVAKLPVHDAAHGFRPGRSILTNAQPHVGRKLIVKFDLKDFFPTVTFGRVRGYLVALGYGYPVSATLAALLTEAERQPVELEAGRIVHVPIGPRHCVQGAPTSPALCNAIVMKLDRRLTGMARKLGAAYTRYADDLTFSTDDPAAIPRLLKFIPEIVVAEGFKVNREKTRVLRSGRAQRVTGVTVNAVAGLSRKERRKLRAGIHQASRDGVSSQRRMELEGKLAYVRMLNSTQADRLPKLPQ